VRQIVLDTETTGLEPELGHRIIEIGAVEIVGRRLTGRHFHEYVDPERDIDEGAVEVHGLTREFLSDKPRFAEVAAAFVDFVRGAEVVIHNAPFDAAFLDHEFAMLDQSPGKLADLCEITDSLVVARRRHPGQKNSLDALCRRYAVDNSERDLHGALLDAELLADVFLLMTGGQTALSLGEESEGAVGGADHAPKRLPVDRPRLRVVKATAAEQAAHLAWMDAQDGRGGAPTLFSALDRAEEDATDGA
jgi:DNA polymerase-3 subunit epsilon